MSNFIINIHFLRESKVCDEHIQQVVKCTQNLLICFSKTKHLDQRSTQQLWDIIILAYLNSDSCK